jgi:hypothetical protein
VQYSRLSTAQYTAEFRYTKDPHKEAECVHIREVYINNKSKLSDCR